MSKAFTRDDAIAQEAVLPLPVGRRPITARGAAAAQRQIKGLLDKELPQLLAAAATGSSPAQSKLEALQRQIRLLERRLMLSDIVATPTKTPKKVSLGTRVTVRCDEDGSELIFALVGPDEVDLNRRRVSHASPVGQALLGLEVGARAFIKRPAGILEVFVKAIDLDDP